MDSDLKPSDLAQQVYARWLGIGDSENVERTTHSSLLICPNPQ